MFDSGPLTYRNGRAEKPESLRRRQKLISTTTLRCPVVLEKTKKERTGREGERGRERERERESKREKGERRREQRNGGKQKGRLLFFVFSNTLGIFASIMEGLLKGLSPLSFFALINLLINQLVY